MEGVEPSTAPTSDLTRYAPAFYDISLAVWFISRC
uniref:Uncharacterized protein n=1 Tax=virus sp. ct9pU4 TaxID=2828248 RepID=A0A8S5RAS4_9VIRU|nr:MAG TPA: hypothetical protein [virus sp. ct9pU4]